MSQRARREDLVVFLGPSLPAKEALRIARCRVLPPARQGDLWRALALQPRAIALVDGVFESVPSVWHHEIIAALDAGVAVFGGASMGALRAAELWREGMIGVGTIFGWYRDGRIRDDSEVALLHAGAQHGHEAFTVPLVNVRHNAERARERGVLSSREAGALVRAAQRVFFKERTWQTILDALGERWPARARWQSFAARGLEDLKALDARACIEAAAQLARAGMSAPPRCESEPSSLVRRRRLHEGQTLTRFGLVSNDEILGVLGSRRMARSGLRTLLLAGWARELGLEATRTECEAAATAFFQERAIPPSKRAAFLAQAGLDAAEVARLFETLALEAKVLENAARMISAGPSLEEGLAFEARRRGLWAEVAAKLARKRRRLRSARARKVER